MSIKFTVFSDFHYEPASGPARVEHMNEIMDSANQNGCEFVLHCGDFAKDWQGSPELFEACLNNKYSLPVYGTYGNHDTQIVSNLFSFVTPRLTNDENAVWATDDGKVGDGEITYYYVDKGQYRFICLDTNHSYFPKEDKVKHAPPGMGEAPIENNPRHILGERQLKWLEGLLDDAAEKGLHCITFSHAGFAGFKEGGWEFPTPSGDIEPVRAMFNKVNKKRPHTVLMSINGHYHTDHAGMADNIVFFSINSTITGWWDCKNSRPHRYGKPLYATVTITDDFQVIIDGKVGCWGEGWEPVHSAELIKDGVRPQISSNKFQIN